MPTQRKEYRTRGRILEIQQLVAGMVEGVFSGERHRLDLEKEIDESIGPDLRIIEDYLALTADRLRQTLRRGVEKGLDRP